MIISRRHRFVFIKTLKAEGTSIEVFLSDKCGLGHVATPIYPSVDGHVARKYAGASSPFPALTESSAGKPRYPSRLGVMRQVMKRRKFFNHMSAVSVRRRVPEEIWTSYFKFCVERNPFEKPLSFYHMLKKRGVVIDVEDLFRKDKQPRDWEQYSAFGRGPILDRALRYEALNEDLSEAFEELGVPFGGTLEARTEGGDRTEKEHYNDVFNDAQRTVLERSVARECDSFGYTCWGRG